MIVLAATAHLEFLWSCNINHSREFDYRPPIRTYCHLGIDHVIDYISQIVILIVQANITERLRSSLLNSFVSKSSFTTTILLYAIKHKNIKRASCELKLRTATTKTCKLQQILLQKPFVASLMAVVIGFYTQVLFCMDYIYVS